MYGLKRRSPIAYEDLLRELEEISRHLLPDNSSVAMDLMVLEARFRERFQQLELEMQLKTSTSKKDLIGDPNDFNMMIPKDLPPFPSLDDMDSHRNKKKTLETIGRATALAIVTAIGVFCFASAIQTIYKALI
ncbi:MAG: hypothetical protein ACKVQC_00620 [Elusimicrobiota bacterium]